ncbi:carcinoembryonic antigen-related cell adhesion molecule 1-like [Paralichthys olivaceus]|uniref:carcinoembryonic antigen-related cell adhesion molecule 1-like n=1 Tax=Paralichthys olivaceus TaxID=8255 RepID=UPI00374FFDC9
MWQTVSVVAALLCLVPSQAEKILHKRLGDDVVLSPGPATAPITSVMWRVGLHIAVQWADSDSEVTYYRHFKERGSLNTSNGEMTIRGLYRDDSEVYTPEINSIKATPTRLIVIAPVPVPTVTTSCNVEMSSCTLTCEGNVTGVESVTYKWKSDDVQVAVSSKDHHVEKENSQSVKEFSCELENPVSQKSSQRITNPFITDPTPERKLNISSGVTVFICLLLAVLLLTLVHRCRAGMWFFQKESMPWEADFWRKHKRPSIEAAGSNEAVAPGGDNEETALK